MKLLKCYIENFGKLHHLEYNFIDGLNIIKEDNGFGKTTFAVFIKSMFYGLDAGTNVKVENSDRKKYLPWQGGNYGGNIEFKINNKIYKIERFFGKKQSEDIFKLYDLSTNLESHDYTENIGEEIFRINKSGYERSTYIPQGHIQIEMEDSINAKLGNVLESENDINTSDDALKIINDTKKIYIKEKGKGGLIDEKKEELNKMERILENSNSDREILEKKKNKIIEINNSLKQIEELKEKEQKILSEKMEQRIKVAKKETYSNIIKKYKHNEENLIDLKAFFLDEFPDNINIKDLLEDYYKLEKIKNDMANCKLANYDAESIKKMEPVYKKIKEEEIDEAIKKCNRLTEIENELRIIENNKKIKQEKMKSNKRIGWVLLIIGFMFFIIGLSFKIMKIHELIGIISFALGSVAVFISFIIIYKNRIRKLIKAEKEIQNLESEKKDLNEQIESLLGINVENNDRIIELTNMKTELKIYNDLAKKQKEIEIDMKKYLAERDKIENKLKSGLLKYYKDINKPYIELIQELSIKVNEYKSYINQFEISKEEKEEFEKENEVEELQSIKDLSDITEEEVKNNILKYNKEIDVLNEEKSQIKNQIEVLENKIDESEYIQTDIDIIKEEIKDMKNKYDILNKTGELLKTAKEKFSSSYLDEMINSYNKYINIINSDELKTNVDIKLNVKVDVNGSQKEIKHFSSGYKDLIYICMRFSLIKTLFKEEYPFVVLDDPFVNLDEEKTHKALQILKELAKQYQILYFVCNESRI